MDPIELAMGAAGYGRATASDYLRLFRMNVGTSVVTWNATTSQSPSARTVKMDLPRVGLASRVLIGVEAVFTAVEAAAAGQPPKSALAPFSALDRVQVKIGGSGSLVDLSGVGAHLANELDKSVETAAFRTQPWPVADHVTNDVQHQVFAWDEATTPPLVTGTARWGYAVPLSLHFGQPLGMVFLGTDRTLATLELTMADLNKWVTGAAFANPAATIVSMTISVAYEYFELPGESAYAQYVQPLLRWAHRITEDRQDIVSVGAGSNIVQLLPYDSILQIAQYSIINGRVDVSDIDGARLRMNRSVVRDELERRTMWREQREMIGRDVPAIVWDYFTRENLRAAIKASEYSDLRIELDIATGTTIAAGDSINTIVRKIVDLGAVAG